MAVWALALLTNLAHAAPAAPARGTTLPACSWDRPGANPFTGDLVAAVDRYSDIPASVRKTLKARMAQRQYDDLAVIQRDHISGKAQYSQLRDMHFASGTVCKTVNRTGWAPKTEERGLVYCQEGHCLIVPTICRNLSRVTKLPGKTAAAEPNGGEALASTRDTSPKTPNPDSDELVFDAPGAGRSFAQASGLPNLLAQPDAAALGGSTDAAIGVATPLAALATDADPLVGLPLLSPLSPLSASFLEPAAADTLNTGTAGAGSSGPGFPLAGVPNSPVFGLPGSGDGSPVVTTPVPEPTTALLMLAGLCGLGLRRRRGRRATHASPESAQKP